MTPYEMASLIRTKALDIGYENCGIVKISAMKGYAEKLDQRIARFPQSRPMYERFFKFAELEQAYPWAKSVVICSVWYGKYYIPEHLKGLIGKAYLVDGRRDTRSSAYRNSLKFEESLHALGLRVADERDYGITALRWAAMQAGIGIVRSNNFFYSKKGSWITLEAWLIDQELELIHSVDNIKKCSEKCQLCVKACPTKALAEPYAINGVGCVSYLTSKAACMPGKPFYDQTGDWVFGCDACQDICPHNKRAWKAKEEFPGLAELSTRLSPEKIVAMDYASLRALLPTKFWYIEESEVWRWKNNALNAMRNTYREEYKPCIEMALHDPHENVRAMAESVAQTVSCV
jgi:epoxyqueuosine reductase